VEGQHIADHPVTVRYLKTVTRDAGCDILYVGSPDAKFVETALGAVSGTGVPGFGTFTRPKGLICIGVSSPASYRGRLARTLGVC